MELNTSVSLEIVFIRNVASKENSFIIEENNVMMAKFSKSIGALSFATFKALKVVI